MSGDPRMGKRSQPLASGYQVRGQGSLGLPGCSKAGLPNTVDRDHIRCRLKNTDLHTGCLELESSGVRQGYGSYEHALQALLRLLVSGNPARGLPSGFLST